MCNEHLTKFAGGATLSLRIRRALLDCRSPPLPALPPLLLPPTPTAALSLLLETVSLASTGSLSLLNSVIDVNVIISANALHTVINKQTN